MPPVDILFQALQDQAADPALLRRVEDGKLHEYRVLATFWHVAREAGLEANMVELTGSNYPLANRDRVPKPKDYWYRTQPFLEIGGELLTLQLIPSAGKSYRLLASRHATREQALESIRTPVAFDWRTANEAFEQEFIPGLVPAKLVQALMATSLNQRLPAPDAASRKPRL